MIARKLIVAAMVAATATIAALPLAHAKHELDLPPNELGEIMVLMYHKIGYPEAEWARTPEAFQEDLDLLYKNGFYLVNLVDLIDGRLKVPAGKTPVVLTFDDGSPGQFKKIDGRWDPKSSVGILKAMYDKNPDFGLAASYYLNQLKGSPEMSAMLQEMVQMGFELGNHTAGHPQLKKLDRAGVEKEIAQLEGWVQRMVPNYRIRTMAMPFGIYPKDASWAVKGSYNGVSFHNEALLEVGSVPAPSPYSAKFNALHIPRVRGGIRLESDKWSGAGAYIRSALEMYQKNPHRRFISDGDPETISVPASRQNEVRQNLPNGLRVKLR